MLYYYNDNTGESHPCESLEQAREWIRGMSHDHQLVWREDGREWYLEDGLNPMSAELEKRLKRRLGRDQATRPR